MEEHRKCCDEVLKILRRMNLDVQHLKDMAYDGCTVEMRYFPKLDAMSEAIGKIRRSVKENKWRT